MSQRRLKDVLKTYQTSQKTYLRTPSRSCVLAEQFPLGNVHPSLLNFILFSLPSFTRNSSLQHVNDMLREQLEQATTANNQLTVESQKLRSELHKISEELEQREVEEEKYFSEEHEKLMSLWTAMNTFRMSFNEMKIETQK